MHKLGWLLIGFGALLLLSKGGLGLVLFPLFFFWPLVLGALFFGLLGRSHRGGHGWRSGPRAYHWRGRSGYYGQIHGCAPCVAASPELHDADRRKGSQANTGETTRL